MKARIAWTAPCDNGGVRVCSVVDDVAVATRATLKAEVGSESIRRLCRRWQACARPINDSWKGTALSEELSNDRIGCGVTGTSAQ